MGPHGHENGRESLNLKETETDGSELSANGSAEKRLEETLINLEMEERQDLTQSGSAQTEERTMTEEEDLNVSEVVDVLYDSYSISVSVAVVAAALMYAALMAACMLSKAYSMWTNIPVLIEEKLGYETNSSEMVEIASLGMYDVIKMTVSAEAYTMSVFISVFSLIMPVLFLILILIVWFAPLTLRVRSRIIRWMSRLGSFVLFFFYAIVLITSYLQVDFMDQNNVNRVLKGQPEASTYIFIVLAIYILVFVEWIFVLHYNSTYWTGKLHGFGIGEEKLRWYFGSNKVCESLCCVSDLGKRRKLDLERASERHTSVSKLDKRQGWQYASQLVKDSNKTTAWVTTMATDMEFIRGTYRYACSRFGFVALLCWSICIAALGILTFTLPVVSVKFVLESDVVQQRNETLLSLGMLVVSPISLYQTTSAAGLYTIAVLFYISVAVLVIMLHISISISLFIPIEHMCGKRLLRGLCHLSNALITFSSFETYAICVIVFSFDSATMTHGLLGNNNTSIQGNGPLQPKDVCYFPHDVDNFCVGLDFEIGLILVIVLLIVGAPFTYYFAETYHRHFGLVADGRSEQTTSSGETTHKHRAEGCIVLACYAGCCCSRIEYTFRQESVDENFYYDGNNGSTFFIPEAFYTSRFASKLSQRFRSTRSAAQEPSRPRGQRANSTGYLVPPATSHLSPFYSATVKKAGSLPRDFKGPDSETTIRLKEEEGDVELPPKLSPTRQYDSEPKNGIETSENELALL